ncbi:glycosyltransferase [Nocardioides sp. zg-1228]|uniref:glycosyltransferase n=1 Tax=Nocardioides sp. zg-1228 TaxID=2763008 RepID=UPI0016432BC6|nr:glycosyltransferase [Nocardioides sp. zg-1228]MBC2934824.1 glycosyltransferase [Nocardioides sp. zg-1228]QSF58385.1 glycosyltransferase [Nocardioides sp. zg-1228]
MTAPPFGTSVPGNRWDLAPAGAPRRRVSVVVTHFEQEQALARTLAALGRQSRPPDEVVVADDGSRQAPVVPPGVRLVRQRDDGFRAAAARNLGVAATTGDVLVLLDADTTPEPGFVERMVALPEALPEALVVGRRRHADLSGVAPDEPVEAAGPPRELPEPAWLRRAYASTRDLLDADASSHRFVISAVLACSRWWWDEVGGFDETFRTYGGEDWEFAHRSWTAGGLLAHRADAVAWHDGPDAAARPRDPDAHLAQTAAVADRTSAVGTTWRGLLRGPADLVVTCAPGLGATELLVTVDSLLAALPRAVVRVGAAHRALVGDDPRVVAAEDDLPATARLHLEVRRGLHGDAAAWPALIDGLDGSTGSRTVADGCVELRDLRLLRRAGRWGRPDLAPPGPPLATSLRPWTGDATLEAWLGGWAAASDPA